MADHPYDRDHDAGAEEVHRVARGDPDLKAQRCRSCKAYILWTITESGKAMPVDFAPVADGTVAITPGRLKTPDGKPGPRVWLSRIVKLGEVVTRRKSHFATCEFADQHRKAKP